MKNTIQVAIDGPAGAGKSTISKIVARELGFVYIDTGAMYRAVALKAILTGVDCTDPIAMEQVLAQLDIDIRHENGEQRVFLDGQDVSEQIRRPEVSVGASNVAVIPAVRLKLVDLQRKLAQTHNVIMDGRDIGTYVLPDARVKIFLTASVDDRAQRRYAELKLKGVKTTLEEVKRDMEYRDKNDSSREFAPLKAAEDAVLVDTTGNELEESIALLKKIIQSKVM